MATGQKRETRLAICLRNEGYEVSLERRKLYEVLEDPAAAEDNLLRVVDESGEDYLYPMANFVLVHLPDAIESAVIEAA